MGKERSNSCIIMLKIIMRKFKKNEVVPNDVKEGHFAVFSVNPEEEPKKFIVELHWLNNPLFLKLLKQAEDEYGFQQKVQENEVVPNDVKEGHFAVFSVNSEEDPTRFIVELHWLNNPLFLKLLKQAEDEYGFQQKGVLEVPCHAAELQNILELKMG
ncbi:hypothetical protein H5410_053628 [Solanum commersonii]|uniref:SAUR family protein n=1 Tax=Solanum commersonii TaxID=4109 RepID=A0A9J5X408_SOLCO|nr:hypothetical protein H5410_053628 [Solanum commersonii]